jgi:hypothetical protein
MKAKERNKVMPPIGQKNPLAEVFGFPITNKSSVALRHQQDRLCPFGNVVPRCTKVSKVDPLGVCSLFDKDNKPTIVCPTRFKEGSLIVSDAAKFFFPASPRWMPLPEVRLNDGSGKSAGNVDFIIVEYDEKGAITDFGALEIQSVYISGNVRMPFAEYMKNNRVKELDWTGSKEYPRPDYLSSSRKRLAPQLIYKGGILRAWNKRIAVVVDRKFYKTLPQLEEVEAVDAEVAWFVYDLVHEAATDTYKLTRHKTLYTRFAPALMTITTSEAGPVYSFIKTLRQKLKKALKGEPVADSLIVSEALE